MNASGLFSVNLNPLDSHLQGTDGLRTGRMSIEKNFSGDLTASSHGEMLTAMTSTQGSAGYVAIEQVTGTLNGKTGSFALQHYGLMNKGHDSLTLDVIPDSGAGELTGISGSMKIIATNGEHSYQFEYSL